MRWEIMKFCSFFYTLSSHYEDIMWCVICWCCHDPLSRKSLNTSGNRHLSINDQSHIQSNIIIIQPHHRPVWCHKGSHTPTFHQNKQIFFLSWGCLENKSSCTGVRIYFRSISGSLISSQVFLVIWLFTCASNKRVSSARSRYKDVNILNYQTLSVQSLASLVLWSYLRAAQLLRLIFTFWSLVKGVDECV